MAKRTKQTAPEQPPVSVRPEDQAIAEPLIVDVAPNKPAPEQPPADEAKKVWPDLVLLRYKGAPPNHPIVGSPSGARYSVSDNHIRAYGVDVDYLLSTVNVEAA